MTTQTPDRAPTPAGRPPDDGIDGLWAATHGANAAWRHARSVQSALDDVAAAFETGDWDLCIESCAQALRGIIVCSYCLEGMKGVPDRGELHLRIAVADLPAAAALRGLPASHGATEAEAVRASAVVAEQDAMLRARLPFELPVIRGAAMHVPTVRVTAQVARWRAERGLGPLDWDRSGI